MTDLQRNRDVIVGKAREYAKAGNVTMAQACFDTAKRIWPVTKQQTLTLAALMDQINATLVTKHVISNYI